MGFLFNRKKKVSKDGTKVDVIKYSDDDNRQIQIPTEFGAHLDELTEHVEKAYPCKEKKPFVFHELISDIVHIDVNIIPPEGERDYYVLWTSGMSDLPMNVPDGDYDKNESNRAEMLMYLPGDWDFENWGETDDGMPNKNYWPIYWIKFLARFPHAYKTWFDVGHTMPNGPDYDPLGEGTKLNGFFFLPPIPLGPKYPGVEALRCKDGVKINFLWAIPMYREEIEFKLEEGFEPMLDLLSEYQLPRVIDPLRENYKKA